MIRTDSLKNILGKQRIVRCICLIISMILVGVGYQIKSFNVLAISMFFVLIHNIFYAFSQIKERILFLILHITIFTFLISRPLIAMYRGEIWWETAGQASENIYFSINLILISMLMLFVGAEIITNLYKKNKMKEKQDIGKKEKFRKNLQVVSMIVFYITMCFFLLKEGEKLLFMQGKTYLDYYTSFQSHIPGIFHTIASFMKYSLCIFLATFPSKKRAFFALALFEISAIPQLLIGVRNPIMLNSLFIFLYYFMRDLYGDSKKWIGKIEKGFLAISIPLTLGGMSALAYLRSGVEVAEKNIFKLIADFFYSQGVTFNVLAIGYGYRNNLPQRAWRNYTFGGIIDYIVHGRIGQKIWGTEALPNGNNYINGRVSNQLAHNLSFVAKQEDYLQGQGWGSSYMLENYIDFGYIGVVIFNLILGMLLIYMIKLFGKSTLVDTMILLSLTTIFFIPRANATGWLTYIVTIQFWACMGACYLGGYICYKSLVIQKIFKKLRLY